MRGILIALSLGGTALGQDYPKAYRYQAQYGADHAVLVPYMQKSQRGTEGRVIVPKEKVKDLRVYPAPQKWVYPVYPTIDRRVKR